MRLLTFFLLLFIAGIGARAQYAPQATLPGSTAIYKSSSQFVAWATGCHVQRGLQQINDASFGYATLGDSSLALGAPDGSIVSLGDSGIAVLTFDAPVTNGPGFDFAVFENGFANVNNPEEAFLELAFVEVSSDGIHFARFPATSLTQDTLQLSSIVAPSFINARQVNNLAGKYIGSYGTPFDLQELAGTPGLDINRITHIRLVDVIGSIGANASRDSAGRKINDPFPTPFPGSGFDLDAVGVLHELSTVVRPVAVPEGVEVYPNPASDALHLNLLPGMGEAEVYLFDATSRQLSQHQTQSGSAVLSLGDLSPGAYYLSILLNNGTRCTKAFLHR